MFGNITIVLAKKAVEMYKAYCTTGGTMGRKYVYTSESHPKAPQSTPRKYFFWIRPPAVHLSGTKQLWARQQIKRVTP
jgi:hypothetical protein